MVTIRDIEKAQKTIAAYANITPLKHSKYLSELCHANVYLKLENQQVTRSFKVRGGINKLVNLTAEEKAKGVITASAGNHGQAVAFGAKELGFSAKVVVPTNTPKVKVDAIKRFGADLLLYGATFTEAEKKAKDLAKQEERLYISPYNDPLIVAGQGTIGLEIIEERPDVDAVVVPVGGGGLIAGISIAVKTRKPDTQVIGVQSTATPIMFESLREGRIVPAHKHEPATIAEGIGGGIERDSITFSISQQYVDRIMLVREETIRKAVYIHYKFDGEVVEGSGAVGSALLLEYPDAFKGQTVVLVVSGGNIDESLLKTIIAEQESA
jgi:threonine dehydratase